VTTIIALIVTTPIVTIVSLIYKYINKTTTLDEVGSTRRVLDFAPEPASHIWKSSDKEDWPSVVSPIPTLTPFVMLSEDSHPSTVAQIEPLGSSVVSTAGDIVQLIATDGDTLLGPSPPPIVVESVTPVVVALSSPLVSIFACQSSTSY
jgi:hypothetical protein